MKKQSRYAKRGGRRKQSKLLIGLSCVAGALLLLLIVMLISISGRDKEPAEATPAASVETTAAAVETTTAETTVETTVPVETEPQMIASMEAEYLKNQDMVGWIEIEGTKLNYPVMYTPNEKDKYLHMDFDQNWSVGGLPFIEDGCSLDPESDNLIIYGHNMANGTMFHTLMSYDQQAFWEEHPTVKYTTLYEERTYEIIAAFYDRVYYKYEDCFKFYQFINARNEEHFNEAITYYKEHALYDTGVTAEYGDSLITLVTCAYHVDNGRFVVVAKDVTERD